MCVVDGAGKQAKKTNEYKHTYHTHPSPPPALFLINHPPTHPPTLIIYYYLGQGKEHDVGDEGDGKEVQHDQASGGHGGVVVLSCQDGNGGVGAGVQPDFGEEDGKAEGDGGEGEEAVGDGAVCVCVCVLWVGKRGRGRVDAGV
jgi:hypothetical protein